jgi:hypothetical protein
MAQKPGRRERNFWMRRQGASKKYITAFKQSSLTLSQIDSLPRARLIDRLFPGSKHQAPSPRIFRRYLELGSVNGKEKPSSSSAQVGDRKVVLEQVARIDVHENHLTIRFTQGDGEDLPDSADARSRSIPWQKPSSRKSRQILIPHGVAPNEVRPTRIERRARLVNAIARGRRWLDEIVSGSVTDVQQIEVRHKCSVRQVNMTISLAFLAPISLRRRWKVVCRAASESSDFAMPPRSGVGSLKSSD